MSTLPGTISSKRDKHFWVSISAWIVIFAYLYCVPYAAEKGGDFVHLWIGGHAVATGNVAQLYEPEFHKELLTKLQLPFDVYWGPRYEMLGTFFYPPLTAILYSPLGALSPYWAQALQAIVNIGLGLLSAWLLTQIIEHRLRFPTVLILLFTFPSFFYAYVLGQNGILTMTVVLGGWYTLKQKKPIWAGAWWSLLLFKPNWLIAIGWIPLFQRRWRMMLGLIAGLLALLWLMVALLGIAPIRAYVGVFIKLAGLHNLPQYPLSSQYSILSLFRRYLGMGGAAELIGWIVVLGIVGLTMWLSWRQHATRSQKMEAQKIGTQKGRAAVLITALGLVAAVCLNPHLHHYDLLLVSVAGVVALSEWSILGRNQRLLLGGFFIFHQLAFLVAKMLGTSIPLPIFAILAIWGWLFVRAWSLQGQHAGLLDARKPSEQRRFVNSTRPAAS